jgi:hypothetical protein
VVCASCEKPSFEHDGECVDCANGLDCANAESGTPLSDLAVLPGYWRRIETSFDLFKCPFKDACVGTASADARRRLEDDTPTNLCGRGYEGVLCSRCRTGFVFNLGRCEDCASMNYTTLTTFVIVVVLVASMMICLLRSRRFAAALESVTVGVEFKVRVAMYSTNLESSIV